MTHPVAPESLIKVYGQDDEGEYRITPSSVLRSFFYGAKTTYTAYIHAARVHHYKLDSLPDNEPEGHGIILSNSPTGLLADYAKCLAIRMAGHWLLVEPEVVPRLKDADSGVAYIYANGEWACELPEYNELSDVHRITNTGTNNLASHRFYTYDPVLHSYKAILFAGVDYNTAELPEITDVAGLPASSPFPILRDSKIIIFGFTINQVAAGHSGLVATSGIFPAPASLFEGLADLEPRDRVYIKFLCNTTGTEEHPVSLINEEIAGTMTASRCQFSYFVGRFIKQHEGTVYIHCSYF